MNRPDLWSALRQDAAIYGLALLLVVVAFVLRSWAGPTLGGQALYLFFVPAVLIAGALGGLGPGLLATALSVVSCTSR